MVGGAGLLLGLQCATRQLSLIMECWCHWPCYGLHRKSGSLRWSIAYLFGVLLCLGRTRWKSPWVTWGPSLVVLSHTRALWLLSRLRRWWGGSRGGDAGHESGSSSTSYEGSSSCESSHSDVRSIEPPVGSMVPVDTAFNIGTEEPPPGPSKGGGGGGAGQRKRKRRAPPPTPRQRLGRRRVRDLGVSSDPEGGGQAGPQVGVEAVSSGIPPTQRCVLRLAPRNLRLRRHHCLYDVPLALRGRATVRSSKPRAFQRNSKDARSDPDPLHSPLSGSSSSAHQRPASPLPFPPSLGLPTRPPPSEPPLPPPTPCRLGL